MRLHLGLFLLFLLVISCKPRGNSAPQSDEAALKARGANSELAELGFSVKRADELVKAYRAEQQVAGTSAGSAALFWRALVKSKLMSEAQFARWISGKYSKNAVEVEAWATGSKNGDTRFQALAVHLVQVRLEKSALHLLNAEPGTILVYKPGVCGSDKSDGYVEVVLERGKTLCGQKNERSGVVMLIPTL